MIDWTSLVLVLLSGLALGTILLFSKRVFVRIAEDSLSTVNALLLPESDDEKLERVEKKTLRLMGSLGSVLLVILVSVGASALFLYLDYEMVEPLGESRFSHWDGLLMYSLGATIPFLIPQKSASKYSLTAQLFHRILLDNYQVGWRLFQWEIKRNEVQTKDEFVVVTGLARAGTTSLLNTLVAHGPFDSLNYGHMPLLMAPRTWSRIYKPKSKRSSERAHGDSIQVSLASEEALEEYFWKVLCEDAYISEKALTEHDLSVEQYVNYSKYRGLVSARNNRYYIAKNNNFLLRYSSVRECNSAFKAIILFRHPLYHAASLLAIHQGFSNNQEEDPFMLEYMNWLGHHEFGLNHKSFHFKGSNEAISGCPDNLDYWLDRWMDVYRRALEFADSQTFFISYKSICERPSEVLNAVFSDWTGVDFPKDLPTFSNEREVSQSYSEQRLEQAMAIYHELLKASV